MSEKENANEIEQLNEEAGKLFKKAQNIKDEVDGNVEELSSSKLNKMESHLDKAQSKRRQAKALEKEKQVESSLNETDPSTKARAHAVENGDAKAAIKQGDGPGGTGEIDAKAYGAIEDPTSRREVLEEKGYSRKDVQKDDTPEELKAAAFNAYLKSMGEKADLNSIERKALNTLKGDKGGFVTDEAMGNSIIRKLEDAVHIRDLANTFQRDESVQTFPTIQASLESTWALELQGINATDDEPFGKTQFDAKSIKMLLKVSEEMIMDSFINLRQELVREASRKYAEVEESAFLNGTGEQQPLGILNWSDITKVLDGSDSSGHQILFFDPMRYYIVDRMDMQVRVLEERFADEWKVGYRFWKRTDASPVDNSAFVLGQEDDGNLSRTDVHEIVYTLKQQYRRNAIFMLHRNTIKDIRNLTDGNNRFIWQPGLQEGEPDTLAGYPIRESEFMPDPEA